MKRLFLAGLLLLAPVLGAHVARAQTEEQALVDRATLTVQEFFAPIRGDDPLRLIQKAKGVIVCPRVFRASFFFGGSGGSCVLVARDPSGGWSYPAFYGMGSGSFGLQAGIQDVELLMLILTDHALAEVMDSQFKIGGDASLTFATAGIGIEGDTTAALGADVVVVNKSRGLFAGLSLQGSVLSTRTGANQAYYGQPLAARQVVLQASARNPGADPLREMLGRYSAGAPLVAAVPPPGYPQPPGYQPAPGGYAPSAGYVPSGGSRDAVSAAPLPPPR